MSRMLKSSRGFTIVELLIVIVVIGILAAITIVAYNGMQERSRISTVQTEINSFLKQVEVYKIDSPANGYPSIDADLKKVLVSSNLWNLTRNANRTYGYCASANTAAIFSGNYINPIVDGVTLYYGITNGGLKTIVYDASTAGAGGIDRICNQILPSNTYRNWAHNLT